MQQVKIYIETDSSSPKATEKHYGYVLEVMVSGQAVTREGFGKITGTYHQTVLTALAKALDRFNQSCEVCICTEDDFVLNMLERNLAIWAGNEFLTSKRKPVANQQEWMEIWRLSNRHLILTEPGKHEYTGWLQGEIPALCDQLTAALGKIDVEVAELKPKEIMEDWVEYLRGQCMENELLAFNVRKKGKSLKGCIAALLMWSFKNQQTVDKDIIKAAGVSAGKVTLGIPGMARAKQIITDYYMGK